MKAVPGPRPESHVDRPTPNIPPRGNSPLTSSFASRAAQFPSSQTPLRPRRPATRGAARSTRRRRARRAASRRRASWTPGARRAQAARDARRAAQRACQSHALARPLLSGGCVRGEAVQQQQKAAAQGWGVSLERQPWGAGFLPCGVDYAWVVWCQWGRVNSQMRARIPSA